MTNGQKLVTTVATKIQGKSFAAGTTFEVFMAANNAKENHLIAICGKNGKAKSITNPKNFVGISQAQVEHNVDNGVLTLI